MPAKSQTPDLGEAQVPVQRTVAGTANARAGAEDPRRWWALVAVGLATFMAYLDR
jgi:hypothetical protein